MIRSPLRPLISILKARHEGINPDIIENQEKAKRLKSTVQRAKRKARQRIFFLSGIFFMSFAAVCFKMTMLASTIPEISKVLTADDVFHVYIIYSLYFRNY